MNSCIHDPSSSSLTSPIHHLLTGTFNTIFLYLLSFNPATSTLSITAKLPANGPHQFLALNSERNRCYTTTWAVDAPSLSCWSITDEHASIWHVNTVPITATSSYIQLSPDSTRLYSAGGPTGEVHVIDAESGAIGDKLQELLYVEPQDLQAADKTRVALRYGSHGIDLNLPTRQAFVPHLGSNSIFMYDIMSDGSLTFVHKAVSFGNGKDGPRHVIFSDDGTTLYTVTEHTSFVDVYRIHPNFLEHLQRASVIPTDLDSSRSSYRGDTLRLSLARSYLYATTRGMTSATQGYLTTFAIDPSTNLIASGVEANYHRTKTSGGKANAIEVYPFSRPGSDMGKDWIVLTDDEQGWVSILEWDAESSKMQEIAEVRLGQDEVGEEGGVGASHAVWLT